MDMIFICYRFSIKGNCLYHLEPEENLEDEHSDQNAEKGKHTF